MSKTCTYPDCNRGCYGEFCILHKPRKRINQRGKEHDRWVEFRENTAIPYLDSNFGHACRCCGITGALDIDHIHNKGSRPELKYQLSNLQYLCRLCHRAKTDNIKCLH